MDQNYVKYLFDYREGKLFWKIRKSDKTKIGSEAGTKQSNGYVKIRIDGKAYRVHRLVYLYHHGFLPEYIDHIDGDASNNHIENLRIATVRQNGQNRSKQINNTSGYKGVYLHKATKKWVAYCDNQNLGYFDNASDADKKVKVFRELKHKEYAKH